MEGVDAGAEIPAHTEIVGFGAADWIKPPKGKVVLTDLKEKTAQCFKVESDQDLVVLQIGTQARQQPSDTPLSTFYELFVDLGTTGHVDFKLWGHSINRPQGSIRTSSVADSFVIQCDVDNDDQWAWRPRSIKDELLNQNNGACKVQVDQLLASPQVGLQ